MRIEGQEVRTPRELCERIGVPGTKLGEEIGLGKYQVTRRLRGEARWTARDALRVHTFLRSRKIRHSLFGLLILLARNE